MAIPRRPDASWGVFHWLGAQVTISTANEFVVVEKKTEELDTTTYLLQSKRNAQRLFEADRDLKAGKGIERSTVSLREEFGLTDDDTD